MKNVKRILAIAGIILLLGIYIAAFVLAFFGGKNGTQMFNAAIISTIIVPIMIYVILFIAKLINNLSK